MYEGLGRGVTSSKSELVVLILEKTLRGVYEVLHKSPFQKTLRSSSRPRLVDSL